MWRLHQQGASKPLEKSMLTSCHTLAHLESFHHVPDVLCTLRWVLLGRILYLSLLEKQSSHYHHICCRYPRKFKRLKNNKNLIWINCWNWRCWGSSCLQVLTHWLRSLSIFTLLFSLFGRSITNLLSAYVASNTSYMIKPREPREPITYNQADWLWRRSWYPLHFYCLEP